MSMNKEQLVKLHSDLYMLKSFIFRNVRSDKDGGMIEYIDELREWIEEAVANLK